MGGGSSESISKSNTLIVNNEQVNSFSSQINKNVTNTIISSAKSCQDSSFNEQSISFAGTTITGNINIGDLDWSQIAKINFSCINANTVHQTAKTGIINAMTSKLSNSASAAVLSKLNSAAKTMSTTSIGNRSNSQSISNYQQHNNINVNLHQQVVNAVEHNFSQHSVSNCIASSQKKQDMNFSNMKIHGNINLGNLTWEQHTATMANCVNKANTGNKIITDLANTFHVSIKAKSKESVKTTAGSSATSTDMLGSIGAAMNKTGKGGFGSTIIMVVIIGAAVVLIPKMMGGSSKDTSGKTSSGTRSISKNTSRRKSAQSRYNSKMRGGNVNESNLLNILSNISTIIPLKYIVIIIIILLFNNYFNKSSQIERLTLSKPNTDIINYLQYSKHGEVEGHFTTEYGGIIYYLKVLPKILIEPDNPDHSGNILCISTDNSNSTGNTYFKVCPRSAKDKSSNPIQITLSMKHDNTFKYLLREYTQIRSHKTESGDDKTTYNQISTMNESFLKHDYNYMNMLQYDDNKIVFYITDTEDTKNLYLCVSSHVPSIQNNKDIHNHISFIKDDGTKQFSKNMLLFNFHN